MDKVEAQKALILRMREVRASLPRHVSEETVLIVQSLDPECIRLKASADALWEEVSV
jgi:hypothetical protein